ncbi:hypothetical protein F4827_001237 [Paraburkholderia bannensis]|uniref:Uncharacterized protein n=1 Tax=Paraburkholderia bannensis TaxID=765414 RepID=A0A7W9TTX4_9BURK|nr:MULTISPECIES: hypothetical protein [Paraburkholderia]MBB3256404.1 hypothetical protein [Paraburkholderia sp. WP4_3_2]MBB6101403.1 hypothetical protein [Paraburkholderia bannensis]
MEAVKVCISNDCDERSMEFAMVAGECRFAIAAKKGCGSRVNAAKRNVRSGCGVGVQAVREEHAECRETTLDQIVRMRCACVALLGGRAHVTLDRHEGAR